MLLYVLQDDQSVVFVRLHCLKEYHTQEDEEKRSQNTHSQCAAVESSHRAHRTPFEIETRMLKKIPIKEMPIHSILGGRRVAQKTNNVLRYCILLRGVSCGICEMVGTPPPSHFRSNIVIFF